MIEIWFDGSLIMTFDTEDNVSFDYWIPKCFERRIEVKR